MKIELTCPQCQSVLRLDAEHAGKLARCPVCSELIKIPDAAGHSGSEDVGTVSSATGSAWGSAGDLSRDEIASQPPGTGGSGIEPDHASPTVGSTNPYAGPQATPTNYRPAPVATGQRQDELWVAGVVLGGASIFIQCLCCSLGVILALPMSSAGLFCTFLSKSPNRWIGFLLNLISMAISLISIAGFVLLVINDVN